MKNDSIELEIIVHPVGGMQLSSGYIRSDEARHFVGRLPGITLMAGDSVDEVLTRLDLKAKDYYGDDVVVELTNHTASV